MPLKRDTKKTPFCMSSNKLSLKYCLQDNHLVGQSVMRPADAVIFHTIKALREGNNEKATTFKCRFLMKEH